MSAITRLGDHVVNFYLIDQPDGLVLVDAGLPGHRRQLQEHLAGRDIRAVLITHGHPDHTGLAGWLQAAGADIWVHERDAPILAGGPRSAMRHAKPERSMLPYLLRRPAGIGTPLHMARLGGFTAAPVQGVRTFAGEGVLHDVPGKPEVVVVPGHTGGSSAFRFPGHDVLFTGDALVMHDGLTGRTGPGLVCGAFTQDSAAAAAALDRLEQVPASLVLTGHGEAFEGTPAAAVGQARRNL